MLHSTKLFKIVAQNAQAEIRDNYSWQAKIPTFVRVYEKAIATHDPAFFGEVMRESYFLSHNLEVSERGVV